MEPAEFQSLQIADAVDLGGRGRYGEVAVVGWSNSTDTLTDQQGRLEDRSLT